MVQLSYLGSRLRGGAVERLITKKTTRAMMIATSTTITAISGPAPLFLGAGVCGEAGAYAGAAAVGASRSRRVCAAWSRRPRGLRRGRGDRRGGRPPWLAAYQGSRSAQKRAGYRSRLFAQRVHRTRCRTWHYLQEACRTRRNTETLPLLSPHFNAIRRLYPASKIPHHKLR